MRSNKQVFLWCVDEEKTDVHNINTDVARNMLQLNNSLSDMNTTHSENRMSRNLNC